MVFSVGLLHPCGSGTWQRDPLSCTRPIIPNCQEQHTAKQWATGVQKRTRSPSLGHNSCTSRGTLLPQPHLVRQLQWPEAWGNGSLEHVHLTLAWAWGSYVPEFKSHFYALPGGHTDEMDFQSCPKHRFLINNARNPCICGTSS